MEPKKRTTVVALRTNMICIWRYLLMLQTIMALFIRYEILLVIHVRAGLHLSAKREKKSVRKNQINDEGLLQSPT